MKTCLRIASSLALCLLFPSAALTQTVVDPLTLEFRPSPDHDTVLGGTPVVTRYDIGFYLVGASAPFQASSLGKPTPAADGLIHVSLSSLSSLPSPGITYESRVSSVGPGGTTPSQPSNTFMFSAPCTYSVAPLSQSVSSASAIGSATVAAGNGCSWAATSNASWLTITGGASGTGNGTTNYSVAANPTTAARTGTLTVAGQTVTVTQAGVTCTTGLSPASQSVPLAGGAASIAVTTPSACSWTAISNATWLTIASGGSGSGNGTVALTAAANASSIARTGLVTAGGQTVQVTQAGTPCTYSAAPASQSFGDTASSGSVSVTAVGGCNWTSTSNASWLAITGSASGTGNGTTAYAVAANPATTDRTGTLTVAGQTVTITQTGAACTFGLSPATQTVPVAGGSASVAVTAPGGCSWTSSSNAGWLTIASGGTGSGNGTIALAATANTSSIARTATVSGGGQSVLVTQAGVSCTSTVSPATQSVSSTSGTGTVTVTIPGGCNWTATSGASWLTVTSAASGTGSGSVAYAYTANTLSTARSGTLTIAGRSVVITQAAACAFTVTPATQSFTAAGGSASGSVTTAAGCSWTATSPASWLTIPSGSSGSGSGTFQMSAAALTGTTSRTATLTVAGRSIVVAQQGVVCTIAVAPTSVSLSAGAGTSTVNVTAGTGCTWAATSDATWLTITSGASGSGNGAVSISATGNQATATRSATLTIGGQTVAVTQAANGGPSAPTGVRIVQE